MLALILSLCWQSPSPNTGTGESWAHPSPSWGWAGSVPNPALLGAEGWMHTGNRGSHSFFTLSLFFCSLVCTTLRVVRKFPRKSSRNVKANTKTWKRRGSSVYQLVILQHGLYSALLGSTGHRTGSVLRYPEIFKWSQIPKYLSGCGQTAPSALLCAFEQSQHIPAILCIPCALTIWKAWLHCIAARTVKGKRKRQFNYKQKELNLGNICHGFLWSKAPLCGAAAGTEPEEGSPNLHARRTRREGETSAPATSRTEILLEKVSRRGRAWAQRREDWLQLLPTQTTP